MFREILKQSDSTAVATAAADAFVLEVGKLLATKDQIHVSITGGSVGILTLVKIGEQPGVADLDWSRVHIWWGDDRFVAADNADRNSLQADGALLKSLPLDAAKVHAFPALNPESAVSVADQLDSAAEAFSGEVSRFIEPGSSQLLFDITILGMGPDGHIASLFPGHAIPAPGIVIVAEHNSPKPPPQRLTFSYEAINNSNEIWFVVAGADKAEAVSVAFSDAPTRLPVGRVNAISKTVWFIDEAAGAGI